MRSWRTHRLAGGPGHLTQVTLHGSGRKESHLQPRGYQPRALTVELRPGICSSRELHPRPRGWGPRVLLLELRPQEIHAAGVAPTGARRPSVLQTAHALYVTTRGKEADGGTCTLNLRCGAPGLHCLSYVRIL